MNERIEVKKLENEKLDMENEIMDTIKGWELEFKSLSNENPAYEYEHFTVLKNRDEGFYQLAIPNPKGEGWLSDFVFLTPKSMAEFVIMNSHIFPILKRVK